ncbi:ABC transporter substrate-binding protein [uncultured Maritimibacter sp.]|jgi:branched-chain amino acid transport system substrate-binding protein|uniref:ABC transporter substrate-binding protein n=1 Tax=uncultured Maritimibacter sp. TaxID=991866 RepID=UPI000ADFE815|nr:ABC transporter substrate-binding protein [uncultured Maritimibacter sp.]
MTTTRHISRRHFGTLVGAGALTAALAPCGFAAAHADTIRIGWVGPRSGPLGIFGEADAWLAAALEAKHADGIEIGGKTYGIEVILVDTQSDPVRASQETRNLINGPSPDVVISSSTPETTNPVADACEALGTPSISTIALWESFYFGRGGTPGEKSFKWTYHFSFGAGDFAPLYADGWSKIETNRKVGMLVPNDADGNAIRAGLIPALEAQGFEIFDAGPYENMTSDFSNQINYFKQNGVDIVNAFPFPPDFPVFWRQAAQLGLAQEVKIMQMAKAGLFAAEMEALGSLGYGLSTGAYWHRDFPTASPATGMTSAELAEGFETTIGKQWTQQAGAQAALLDVTLAAFVASGNPHDKAAVAAALDTLTAETAVGTVDFANGPMPGIATAPLVNCQWVKAADGPYEFALDVTANVLAPDVPISAELKPYKIGG